MSEVVDTPELRARFEAKFARGEACWNWTASKGPKGYGQLMIDRRPLGSHRIAWQLYVGPIPAGMHVLHRCDNRTCANPAHLFLGTNADNVADMVAKHRQGRAGLTHEDVLAIRASSDSTYALGRQYGVDPSTIGKIKNGISWKAI